MQINLDIPISIPQLAALQADQAQLEQKMTALEEQTAVIQQHIADMLARHQAEETAKAAAFQALRDQVTSLQQEVQTRAITPADLTKILDGIDTVDPATTPDVGPAPAPGPGPEPAPAPAPGPAPDVNPTPEPTPAPEPAPPPAPGPEPTPAPEPAPPDNPTPDPTPAP
jgi:hypothetical protein